MITQPRFFWAGSLLAVSLLTACPPQSVVNTPVTPSTGASASPSASSSPGNSSPTSSPTASPATSTLPDAPPTPGSSPSAPVSGGVDTSGSATVSLPANLSSIRFATIDRFLDAQGEVTRFQVEFVDNLGNRISGNVPLLWSSSRPQDFSVDAEGNVKALVDFGFSTIEVRIPGTAFEARTIVNVTSSSGGGSGGGGSTTPVLVNAAPVINSLVASSNTVVGAGVPVKLTASATDAETSLSDASYSWSCTSANCANAFSTTTGPTVFWSSPAAAGAYVLKLTVSDGSQTTSREITINVTSGQGQLQINPPAAA